MDYGNLLTRSWNIVWNNKFLFLLGFLAALGAGGGGGGNGNINFSADSDTFALPEQVVRNIEQFWALYGVLIIGLIFVSFIVGIVFWLIRLTAQAGMIDAVVRLDAGKDASFRTAFSTGTSLIWRMVGLNLLAFGPFVLIGFIAAVAGITTVGGAALAEFTGAENAEAFLGGLGILLACFGLLACLFVPLYLLVQLIYAFAQRGLVLNQMGVVDSFRHGWVTVRENIGEVFLLAVLFTVIGFVFGLVAAVVLIPFAFISAGPIIFSLISGETVTAANIVVLAIGGIVLGVIGAAINSILIAFRSTAVTLAYQEFVGKSAVAVE